MKKAFKIYKEGKTNGWITILVEESNFNPSFIQMKMDKYIWLGYQVKSI